MGHIFCQRISGFCLLCRCLFFFVASFFEGGGEAEAGGQAIALVIALVGIPFLLLARYGWRLSHVLSGDTRADSRVAQGYDLTEGLVQVIETTDKALFFTYRRLIVAHVEGLSGWGYGGPDALSILAVLEDLGRSLGVARKIKQLSKLSPQEILVAHRSNFAIPYSEIIKVKLFKKMLRRKIRVTITVGTTLEYWLSKPWQVKKYVDALRTVLPDKLEVS